MLERTFDECSREANRATRVLSYLLFGLAGAIFWLPKWNGLPLVKVMPQWLSAIIAGALFANHFFGCRYVAWYTAHHLVDGDALPDAMAAGFRDAAMGFLAELSGVPGLRWVEKLFPAPKRKRTSDSTELPR
jgi:hypothetical protein